MTMQATTGSAALRVGTWLLLTLLLNGACSDHPKPASADFGEGGGESAEASEASSSGNGGSAAEEHTETSVGGAGIAGAANSAGEGGARSSDSGGSGHVEPGGQGGDPGETLAGGRGGEEAGIQAAGRGELGGTAGVAGTDGGSEESSTSGSGGSSADEAPSYDGFSDVFVYARDSTAYLVAQDDQGTSLSFLAEKADDGLPTRLSGIAIDGGGELRRYEFDDQGRLTRAQTEERDVTIDYTNLADGTINVRTTLPTGAHTSSTQTVAPQDVADLTFELPDTTGTARPNTLEEFVQFQRDFWGFSLELYEVVAPIFDCVSASFKKPIYQAIGVCAVSALSLSDRTNRIVSYLQTAANMTACASSVAEIPTGVLTIPGVLGLLTACPAAVEDLIEILKDLTNAGGGRGDPHLFTFDRYFYDLQRVGEFLFVQDAGGDHVVQVRFAPYGESRNVAIIKSIAANVDGTIAEVGAAPATFYVDGAESAAASLAGGGVVSPTSFVWADGARLEIADRGTHLDVSVRLPSSPSIVGLIGNADGDPTNDLALRDGTMLTGPLSMDEWDEFADSWRITQEESLFVYGSNETTETYTDLTFPGAPMTAASLDEDVFTAARGICEAAGILDEVLLDACILDVGIGELDDSLAEGWADVPPPLAADPAIHSFAVDYDLTLTVDNAGSSAGDPVSPDGRLDGVFDVVLRGPVTGLVLATTGATGTPAGGSYWDTLVGEPIPTDIPHLGGLATAWNIYAQEDGEVRTDPDGSLNLLDAESHVLKLYVSTDGSIASGQRFRLYAVGPGGVVMSPVLTY